MRSSRPNHILNAPSLPTSTAPSGGGGGFTPARCRAWRRICASVIVGWSAAADGKLAMSSPAIPATPGGLCGIKIQAPHAIDATMFP